MQIIRRNHAAGCGGIQQRERSGFFHGFPDEAAGNLLNRPVYYGVDQRPERVFTDDLTFRFLSGGSDFHQPEIEEPRCVENNLVIPGGGVNRFAFDPDLEIQRLGFRLQPFEQWPLKKALEFLSQTGYRSVEISLDHPDLQLSRITPKILSEVRSFLEETDLKVSAVSYLCRDKTLEDLTAHLRVGLNVAYEIGAPVFILCAGPLCDDPGGRNTRAALIEILNQAEERGIAVAVEPEPESVLHGLYEFSDLARRLAGSPLRLNLNLTHTAITEGSLDDVIENWSSYIVHVHVSDVRGREHAHLLPGDGYLDILSIVRKLREHNYNGDWTLDMTGQPDPPEQLAQKAIERCRGIFS